ncbi:MAG: response regulator [Acidobacteria bacterium]|nr:response regulator [Acidobacteriota bacterium]
MNLNLEEVKTPAKTSQTNPTAKQHVLLVEDSKVSQKVTAFQLKCLGYTVDIVENGYQALQALNKNSYGLILMDCLMPEMDGYQATKEIRQNERATGNHIPIIGLTGHELVDDRNKCLSVGMDGYLSKPAEVSTLVDTLNYWYPSEKTRKLVEF